METESADIITQIRTAVREEIRSVHEPGYLDARESATYIGFSLRKFDEIADQIPCHRVLGTGKRLYKRDDLDAFMAKWRQVPQKQKELDALVGGVVDQITKGRR